MDKELTEDYILDGNSDNSSIDDVSEDTSSISYQYIFYIILSIVAVIFIVWIIISMFSSEPPIIILNQMLNSNLEIASASD